MSATDIYGVGNNADYAYMLGQGRLSVVDALVDTLHTAVRMVNPGYQSALGPYVVYDDTLYLTGELVSYLQPWQDGTATLSTESPYVTLLDSIYSVDSLGTLDGTGEDTLFVVYLNPDLPAETELLFRINFEGTGYEDYQHFRLNSEDPFLTVDNGSLSLTVGDNGTLGYYEDVRANGIGWLDGASQLMTHMGWVLALDSTRVADNTISHLINGTRSADFEAITPIKRFNNPAAGLDVRSWFQDTLPDMPAVRVQQRWLTDATEGGAHFLVAEYRLVNTGDTTVQGLYMGFLADWEVGEVVNNQVGYDSVGQLGYVTDSLQTEFIAVAWLTVDSVLFRAIDWGDENGNDADVDSTLSDAERFALLTNEDEKIAAGMVGMGNDVGIAAGYFLDSLTMGQNQPFAFALLVATTLDELRDLADSARTFYQAYQAQPETLEVLEVCADAATTLDPAGSTFHWYADVAGDSLLSTGNTFTTGGLSQDTVFYVENLDSGFQSAIYQVLVHVREPEARFTLTSDTLVISEGDAARAEVVQSSVDAVSYIWDFGTGTQSTLVEPSPAYFTSGTYTLTLAVSNRLGCVDSMSQQLRVLQRATPPEITDLSVCYGASALLSVSGGNALAVYPDSALEGIALTGTAVNLGPIFADTTVWVTNQDSVVESLPVEVAIKVVEVGADFTVWPDTTVLDTLGLILLDASLAADAWTWYINDSELGNQASAYAELPEADSLALSLVAETTSQGCVDSVGLWILPHTAPEPEPTTVHACPGEEVSWRPNGGTTFVFARDVAGEDVLHKGALYVATSDVTDTVWVANLDGFVPTQFQPMVARRVSAQFGVYPDQESFQVLDTSTFLASDELIDTYLWQINEGALQTQHPLENIWLAPGDFTVSLHAIDSLGCQDALSQIFTVVPREPVDTVTGLPQAWLEDFLVYPNPASESVTLRWPEGRELPVLLRLVDSYGRVVQAQGWTGDRENILDLDMIEPGPYWVQLVFAEGTLSRILWLK
ncbi:MAG TPA: hypothetical protein DCR93_13785 [Cytophagales bacterium]|nr:hypothetical protein [Cytophagales bacterium]